MFVTARFGAVVLSLHGCTLTLDSEREQCSVDADCNRDGRLGMFCREGLCVGGRDFSCLDEPAGPLPDDVSFDLLLVEEGPDTPIAGADIRVCQRLDFDCESPVSSATTDASGRAALTTDLSDYFEFRADGYRDTIAMGISGMELAEEEAPLRLEFSLYSVDSFNTLAAVVGASATAGRGDLDLGAVDCTHTDAPGVDFVVEPAAPEMVTAYIANDLPSTVATETDTESASAFVFNASTGLPNVTSRIVADGRTIGPTPIIVRDGWLTDFTAAPPGVYLGRGLE